MTTSSNDPKMERLKASVQESLRVQEAFFFESWAFLAEAFETVVHVLRKGGKLIILGNGGSAADAQHLAAELVNRFETDRPALAALAITTDSSILTSVGNDMDFRHAFARQVEALGKPGDLLIAISTSGNSPNVLEAVRKAKEMGLKTLALTGGKGGKLKELSEFTIRVASSERTSRIQEALLVLEHLLCEWIDSALFPAES